MTCAIKNPSKIDLTSLEPHVRGMYDYFNSKIGFNKPPTIYFDSEPSNQSKVLGKTAYYDPSTLEIHIFTDGRHPKDMLRSIAHELIHHQQNEEGRLEVGGYMGEGYYLKNEEMKKLEQEAMLEGNALMREYEDNLKLEEKNKMSLKEWKNNELNKELLKKFGILKEEKKKMVKDPKTGKMVPDYAIDGKGDKDLKEEELEEGRNNPRTTNSDKFVGHEDRYQPDRIHEEEELDEASCGDKKELREEDELEEGGAAARTGNENHDAGKERMSGDRKHESKTRELQESIKRIAKANKVVLKSIKKRIR